MRPYSKAGIRRNCWSRGSGGLALDELPVPRIIVVAIAPGEAPDLDKLREALAEQVPPASLDDHRGFVDHMRAMTPRDRWPAASACWSW